MIRIKKLYTYPEIIKPIYFKKGLNFILGEKDESSNKTNGVGKSMSIEFLNFCLLRKKTGSRVFKIPKAILNPDTKICLDLKINNKDLTIIRTVATDDKPEITLDGNTVTFDSIENALNYLNDLFYTNKSKINLNPSFRELLNPSIRDERSEFKDIVSYFDTKNRVPADHTTTLYLLDFDIAAYRLAQNTITEIDKYSRYISDLNKSLTQNGLKSLTDVRAEVNSKEEELEKLENDLEELKTYESFEKVEDDLISIDLALNELRTQQTYLKLSIQKIRLLPEIEKIDEADVLFIYEQFKQGLGNQLKKSFEQVNSFKEKIENFQNHIVNEKLKTLLAKHKIINKKIRSLDDNRSGLLKAIDKKGVFKNLKQSLAIYHRKSEESSNIRTQLKSYDYNKQHKNRLKSNKSNLVTKVDEEIVNNDSKIDSFNKTIANIHQYIMGNKGCSFTIETVNRDTYRDIVKFNMSIDYGGSHSVERAKVFIYDVSLLLNQFTKIKHPRLLIHDNIFDVDQDTLLRSLNFLYSIEDNNSFQYILTLNSDKVDDDSSKKFLDFNIHDYARAIYTKSNRFIIGDKYSEIG
ncbi:DUF2326 domain-containing protein [Flavivirga amylovorans]|uniref:DUF2326 domain-containing protein n=1 Tax=Flavivirga amylovorans TaxID=870486 RepID=A0ABT8X1H3_9FLAO|nr:DUF2326 domain-containing protein [Flavivirga amylovorans]MDO5987798.1 DUF2326 domain-containing protein [Flavivirga amylovorans]